MSRFGKDSFYYDFIVVNGTGNDELDGIYAYSYFTLYLGYGFNKGLYQIDDKMTEISKMGWEDSGDM